MSGVSTEQVILPSGLRVTYRLAGEGPPVLLLHGWAASWHVWHDAMLALAAGGFRAYAPDHIGCGDSAKPLSAYTPSAYAAYVDGFVAALGIDQFTLVGHSLGGHIALSYALAHPGKVSRLMLVAPAYSALRQTRLTRAEGLLLFAACPVVGALALALAPARLIRWFFSKPWGGFYRPDRIAPEFLDSMALDYTVKASPWVTNSAAYLVLFSLPFLSRLRRDADLRPRLKDVAMRTLVVWGEHDALLSPRSFRELAAAIPNATAWPLADAGHTPPVEAADKFNSILMAFVAT